jgi:hypothetical protein
MLEGPIMMNSDDLREIDGQPGIVRVSVEPPDKLSRRQHIPQAL